MALQFCRHCDLVMVRNARVAFVRFGRGHAFVSMIGVEQSIPDLIARGVNGCTKIKRVPGSLEAYFPRVTQSTLLAELAEAFDIVVDERRTAEYRCELDFLAALVEYGCGPLPTLRELLAYDRGVADAERSVAARVAEARREASLWSVEHVARLNAELHDLRATVDRQRAELNKRPTVTTSLERAERQRAADVELVQALGAQWSASMPGSEDERGRERARGRVDAAHLIATELREREVVR